MMRFFVSVLATAGIFLAATVASATNITTTASGLILTGPNAGSTNTALAGAGDQVQVDIMVRTDGGLVQGATLAAGQVGGGLGSLTFDGGLTAAVYFNSTTNKFGSPSGGLANVAGTSNGTDGAYTSVAIPRALSASDVTLNGNVLYYAGFTVGSAAAGDGSALDIGILDGATSPLGGTANIDFTSAGALHARLLFTIGALGSTPIFFGNAPIDSSITDQLAQAGSVFSNSLQLGPLPVPEPGTALLMGLGLTGLSLAGRRRA